MASVLKTQQPEIRVEDVQKDFSSLKKLIFKGDENAALRKISDIRGKYGSELGADAGKKLDKIKKMIEDGSKKKDILDIYNSNFSASALAKIVPVRVAGLDLSVLSKLDKEKKSRLRDSLIYLEKGKDINDVSADNISATAKLENKRPNWAPLFEVIKSVEMENQMAQVLGAIGFPLPHARFYAKKIFNDKPFFEMLKSASTAKVGSDPVVAIDDAKSQMSKLYVATDVGELRKMKMELEKYGLGEDAIKKGESRAAMNFVVARVFGDIYDTANRMKLGVPKDKAGKPTVDETQVLASMLDMISKDRLYAEQLKEYKKQHVVMDYVSSLHVLGKYAFFTKTYPTVVKKYGSGSDYDTFMNYMTSGKYVPSQIQYSLFSEAAPYLVANNNATDATTAIGTIYTKVDGMLAKNMWNIERNVYGFGTHMMDAIKATEGAWTERMINMMLKDPNATSAANKATAEITPDKFDQYTPEEVVENRINELLGQYVPTLNNSVDTVLDIKGVKDVDTLIEKFRKLMAGKSLNYLEIKRPSSYLSIKTDMSELAKQLEMLVDIEPVPEIYTWQSIVGSGNFTYLSQESKNLSQDTKQQEGAATLTYSAWGTGKFTAYTTVEAQQMDDNTTSSGVTVGSTGRNMYSYKMGGYTVDYDAKVTDWSGKAFELQTSLDAYKGKANTLVQLNYDIDAEGHETYEMVLYRKNGNAFAKVGDWKMGSDQAANIFGGYVDYNTDARTLFQDGHLRGLVLGYQMTNAGFAELLNATDTGNYKQFTQIVSYMSDSKKDRVGVMAYTDKVGSEQLGLVGEHPNAVYSAAAGKQEGETVYAALLQARTGTVQITAAAKDHLGKLAAAGVSSKNAYVFSDFIEDSAGAKTWETYTGFDVGKASVDITYFSKKRDTNYKYSDDVSRAYKSLIDARATLSTSTLQQGAASDLASKIEDVSADIDYLRSMVGDQFKSSMQIRNGKDYTAEFIGGDTEFLSVASYGKDSSYRVSGGLGGGTEGAEVTRVGIAQATADMASLVSIKAMSFDDAYALMGSYARSTNPLNQQGSGMMTTATYGEKISSLGAGAFFWNDPEFDTTKTGHAIIVRVDKSPDLTTGAIGAGKSSKTTRVGEVRTVNVYIIGGGALDKSEIETTRKEIEAAFVDLGISFSISKPDITETVTGGVKVAQIKKYAGDGKATYVNVYFNGTMTWGVEDGVISLFK